MDVEKQKFLEGKFSAALAKQGGESVPEKEPTTTDLPEPDVTEKPAEETPAPEPATEDEWAELKKEFGSPKSLKERLENTRSMQDEAHRRNEEARRRNEETRLLFEQTQRMQAQQDAQMQAVAQMGEADPVAGAQLLGAMAKQRQSGATNQLPNDSGAQALLAKMQRVQDQLNAQQWGYNKAISIQAATEVMNRSEVFKGIDKDLFDGAVNEAFNQLVQRDAANQGSVDPMNPTSFRPIVEDVVKSLEKKYGKWGEARLTKWKAEHAINAKKAPPSSKGPAASVRSGPPPAPAASKNMSMRARGDRFEELAKARLASMKDEVS